MFQDCNLCSVPVVNKEVFKIKSRQKKEPDKSTCKTLYPHHLRFNRPRVVTANQIKTTVAAVGCYAWCLLVSNRLLMGVNTADYS